MLQGGLPDGLLVANDDNWARCATAVRRAQQHQKPVPLLWLCGDARNAESRAAIVCSARQHGLSQEADVKTLSAL